MSHVCAEMEEIGAHEREAKKKALFVELKTHMEQTRAVRRGLCNDAMAGRGLEDVV